MQPSASPCFRSAFGSAVIAIGMGSLYEDVSDTEPWFEFKSWKTSLVGRHEGGSDKEYELEIITLTMGNCGRSVSRSG